MIEINREDNGKNEGSKTKMASKKDFAAAAAAITRATRKDDIEMITGEAARVQEATSAVGDMPKTQGRKGEALPRINMAFSPANYMYIKTMAAARGCTLRDYINQIIDEHRASNEAYSKVSADLEALRK